MTQIDEAVDLALFREQWKAEVRERQLQATGQVASSSASASKEGNTPSASDSATEPPSSPVDSRARSSSTASGSAPRTQPTSQYAVEMYRQAVVAEEQGEFDIALGLYRRAFKINPSVDALYHQSLRDLPPHARSAAEGKVKLKSKPQTQTSAADRSRELSALLSDLHLENLRFTADDEKLGAPISLLPDELIVHILNELMHSGNIAALERFALINRKSRVLTLEQSLWRPLVHQTYIPPQIPDDQPIDEILGNYSSDYRKLYIEHPRVRLDGVYIAVCYYARQGQHENAWVKVLHWVTYHRYLRFLPNGTVLSLLTNEEQPPAEVVHKIKPTLQTKGFYIGKWQLVGNRVIVDDLVDAWGGAPTGNLSRYGFSMTLNLKSRPLGRWNKLEMESYNSVHLETGDTDPLPIKQEKPFWFSRVKSYAVTAAQLAV